MLWSHKAMKVREQICIVVGTTEIKGRHCSPEHLQFYPISFSLISVGTLYSRQVHHYGINPEMSI